MRQLTQLEAIVAVGRTARERYRVLARAGCLSPAARLHPRRVQAVLDVWPADPHPGPLTLPDGAVLPGPLADQPPVEAGIVQELERCGYLSGRARALDARVPGDWEAARWLRAPAWRRLLSRRPPALRT